MAVELLIQNRETVYEPVVAEGIRLTWEQKRAPGKLEFTVVKDPVIDFLEGNPVRLSLDGACLFYGYVFTKTRNRDGLIRVTAYDQLRYLKNKDTITAEGLTASGLLRRIAADFRLTLGAVEETGYPIETIVEENQTLFDMIQGALDETRAFTGERYVLYDDAGRLTLKNVRSMRLELLIDSDTAEDFFYESSIDFQTYNKIKLVYNDEKRGRREVFTAQDGRRVGDWGVLQYYEELKDAAGASARAQALLRQYDHKTRRLTIRGAFGDARVRAGTAVLVSLNLGDIIVNQSFAVERVIHTFREGEHTMELTLIGGEFIA